MKVLKSLITSIAIIALMSFGSNNADHKITVIVSGFKNEKGNCVINLYNKSEGFPNSNTLAYKSITATIKNNSAQIVFENINPGTYAVSILHDAMLTEFSIKICLEYRKKVTAPQITKYLPLAPQILKILNLKSPIRKKRC